MRACPKIQKIDQIAVFLLLSMAVLFPLETARAYLDAGTGSYVIQILIGVVFGGVYTLKIFGKRILAFFKRFFQKTNEEK